MKAKTARERIEAARRRFITGTITQEQLQAELRHRSVTKSELYVWLVIQTVNERRNYERRLKGE